jgi:hypothetical protein
MPTTDEMLKKLADSVRIAHDEREANSALGFASGYVRALDDFSLITPEESQTARKLLRETRNN